MKDHLLTLLWKTTKGWNNNNNNNDKESLRLEKTCWHSNSNEKPSASADVKNYNNNNNNKYLDLAWELKKLWNMKVIIIPIVIGALVLSPNDY